MATVYPLKPRLDFLAWCEAHVEPFTGQPRLIGLSVPQAQAWAAAVAEVRAAEIEQERARRAALAATAAAEAAYARLRARTGEAVRTIRAYAEAQGEDEVFERARIPRPAPPAPAPPPAPPHGLRAELDPARGALTLAWKATQPRGTEGTSYVVRRRLLGETVFSFVGVTGAKRFTDETIPAGCAGVQYTVQAQRGAHAGPASAIFTAHLGTPERPAAAPRLAA